MRTEETNAAAGVGARNGAESPARQRTGNENRAGAGATQSLDHYVKTKDAQQAVENRRPEIVQALGIPWRAGQRDHIRCPYTDHGGADDWRLNPKERAICTCTGGSTPTASTPKRAMLFDAGLRVENKGEHIAVKCVKAADPAQEITVVRRPGWHGLDTGDAPFFRNTVSHRRRTCSGRSWIMWQRWHHAARSVGACRGSKLDGFGRSEQSLPLRVFRHPTTVTAASKTKIQRSPDCNGSHRAAAITNKLCWIHSIGLGVSTMLGTDHATLHESRDAITQFLFLSHPPQPVDLCFVLGCPTPTNMKPAIALYEAGLTPAIVIAGHGPSAQAVPESEIFRDYALQRGVPREVMVVETASSNTRDNFAFARPIIDDRYGWDRIRRVALVAKPFHMRRAVMTARRQWPGHLEFVCRPSDEPDDPPAATWWQTPSGRHFVLNELRAIGAYALQGDLGGF